MAEASRKKKDKKRSFSRRRRLFLRSAGRAVWSPGQRRLLAGISGLVVLLVLGWGAVKLVDYYLMRSGRYVLRHVDVQAGETITRERICEYLKLQIGMPLFEIDISRRQQELLRDAATIRSLTITRTMPDRLSVSVIERQPLARLASRPFAVDRSGCVFVRYHGIELLPCISGYNAGPAGPGARLEGMATVALDLLDALKNNAIPLQIVDVDVSHEDFLDCTMSDQRRAKLAWTGIGDTGASSNRFLLAQLQGLATAMNSERGRERGTWDATVQGRAYAR